jgi:hypothetical protein
MGIEVSEPRTASILRDAVQSSETLVSYNQSTWRYNTENHEHSFRLREKLESQGKKVMLRMDIKNTLLHKL